MNVQHKPSAAYAISLVAGIFIILIDVIALIIFSIGMWTPAFGWDPWGWHSDGWWLAIVVPLLAVGLVFGIIITIAAAKLRSKPAKHETWGIVIIIF